VESLASGTTSDQQTVTDEKLKGGRFSRIEWVPGDQLLVEQQSFEFRNEMWILHLNFGQV
jgi:hypothetical protein